MLFNCRNEITWHSQITSPNPLLDPTKPKVEGIGYCSALAAKQNGNPQYQPY